MQSRLDSGADWVLDLGPNESSRVRVGGQGHSGRGCIVKDAFCREVLT